MLDCFAVARGLLIASFVVLISANARAQDVPQNQVSVEGTDYGSVFDRGQAASERAHLALLKIAIAHCDKGEYELASAYLWGDYLDAKARYEKFQQGRTFGKKLRSGVWGGQDVFARLDARLKHDVDEALKIYNQRPPFQCAVPQPPPPPPPPPNAGGGTPAPPETPPVISKAQRVAENGEKVLSTFSGCIPPALAKSWISLLFSQELAVIKFSKDNRSILDNDPLIQRLDNLLKEFDRRKCVPPEQPKQVGGGFYERPGSGTGGYRTPGMSPDGSSGVRFFVSVEGGFTGAQAHYDELSIDPRSFIGGGSVGVRVAQPNNMFVGAQVSVLGTDLTKEAVPGFSVGLRWGVPVDILIGTTFQNGSMPVSVYGFAGPMWGRTRVSSAGVTDYFTLVGPTAGIGVDVQLNQNWSVGAKARAFTLGASDRGSEGQHVQGGSLTFSVGYGF
ncbi:outer membrane protein [Bradyrhizobium commune]|uniref:Porin family protein n=1 Tax=Bradyrhizobium commune TaxID=83627 RepID=A0A7S9D1V4_9BRAD|nr:outer membrane beta-barrel protein [Bradyrhizobium commune]QPF89647.1 porin family protein [Bradyrhizobium commune]